MYFCTVNSRVMIFTLNKPMKSNQIKQPIVAVAPIGSRLQSFSPYGALSWVGKVEINAPINIIIIIIIKIIIIIILIIIIQNTQDKRERF